MTPRKVLISHSFLHGLGRVKFVTPYSSEFRPRISLMSRYARRIVNNSYYGVIGHDGT